MKALPRDKGGADDESSHPIIGDLATISTDLLTHLQMPKGEIVTMQTCLKELVAISQQLGQDWRISSFGSAASGFYTRFSDLDVTCYQLGEVRMSARDSLAKLHPFVAHGNFEVTEVISSARIPLLKMRYCAKLDVDVSFQNSEPLPNTQLLRAYARLSPIIRHLVVLVKVWAKADGVCGAQDGHLSSYSFTLMTLYFLQVDPMVKLPCFPTQAFTGHKHIPPEAHIKWECPLSLPALVNRFFEFYTTSFHWGYEVISIRTGSRLYSNNPMYRQLAGRDVATMIHIEDPFLLNRNLNCVLGMDQHTALCKRMTAAHQSILAGAAPEGFRIALTLCSEKAVILDNPVTSAAPGSSKDSAEPAETNGNEAKQLDDRQTKTEHTIPAKSNGNGQMSHVLDPPLEGYGAAAPAPEMVPTTALFKSLKIK